jgi:hypothetical protein
MGPPPETALAPELPAFRLKRVMRRALDLAPPNLILNLCLGTPPVRRLAQHVYFHRRGTSGITFEEFERRLSDIRAWEQHPCAKLVCMPGNDD